MASNNGVTIKGEKVDEHYGRLTIKNKRAGKNVTYTLTTPYMSGSISSLSVNNGKGGIRKYNMSNITEKYGAAEPTRLIHTRPYNKLGSNWTLEPVQAWGNTPSLQLPPPGVSTTPPIVNRVRRTRTQTRGKTPSNNKPAVLSTTLPFTMPDNYTDEALNTTRNMLVKEMEAQKNKSSSNNALTTGGTRVRKHKKRIAKRKTRKVNRRRY